VCCAQQRQQQRQRRQRQRQRQRTSAAAREPRRSALQKCASTALAPCAICLMVATCRGGRRAAGRGRRASGQSATHASRALEQPGCAPAARSSAPSAGSTQGRHGGAGRGADLLLVAQRGARRAGVALVAGAGDAGVQQRHAVVVQLLLRRPLAAAGAHELRVAELHRRLQHAAVLERPARGAGGGGARVDRARPGPGRCARERAQRRGTGDQPLAASRRVRTGGGALRPGPAAAAHQGCACCTWNMVRTTLSTPRSIMATCKGRRTGRQAAAALSSRLPGRAASARARAGRGRRRCAGARGGPAPGAAQAGQGGGGAHQLAARRGPRARGEQRLRALQQRWRAEVDGGHGLQRARVALEPEDYEALEDLQRQAGG
jgi:hypothetical protein